jgi:integrase
MAERAALLSGRDDELVQLLFMGFTGARWGETVGLETRYVRPGAVRIEWQLYELDTGVFHRCPPKDDSHRTVAVPDWLSTLLREHVVRTSPGVCGCHGFAYVFSGHRPPNTSAQRVGPKLIDVARRAGVSVGTASTFLNHPDKVAPGTAAVIAQAVEDLGYVRGVAVGTTAAHHRRNGFATWVFQPAATGWYPAKAPAMGRPVPVLADPWPGVPVRGRNAAGRADCCWVAIAPGLTPHGLRHTYKTMMLELGTPAVLMDEQMGHEDGSIQGRYSHATADMRARLLGGLTDLWRAALGVRRELHPTSPVATLDRLLREEARS